MLLYVDQSYFCSQLESVEAVRAVIQRLKREYITALFLLGVESTQALIGREELIRDEDRD